MKIHRNLVTPAKPVPFAETIDFSGLDYSRFPSLRGLKEVYAEGEFFVDDEDFLCASLAVKGVATLSDSRTLEEFEEPFDFEDEFALLRDPSDEAEGYVFPENVIELSDVVFCAIHSHLPLCPHKKDSPLPESGEGYRVLREEEMEPLENASPFDALADYDPEEGK